MYELYLLCKKPLDMKMAMMLRNVYSDSYPVKQGETYARYLKKSARRSELCIEPQDFSPLF
jgi:hypothetical protein